MQGVARKSKCQAYLGSVTNLANGDKIVGVRRELIMVTFECVVN